MFVNREEDYTEPNGVLRKNSLPDHHHDDHHDWEDGDGVAGHVHDEEVHGDLLQRTQGNVPATLDSQVWIGFSEK